MDIQKLLNRKSARKEARKTQKKLAKIVKVARTKKVNPDEAVSAFLNKGRKKKKNNQKKSGPKTKTAKAAKIAEKVRRELEEGNSEEEAYYKDLKTSKNKALREGIDSDDAEIKKYEKLLGLDKKKTKNVPTTIVEDGLGDLWEFCDPQKRQRFVEEDDENDLGTRQLAEYKDEDMIDLSEENKNSRKRKHTEITLDESDEDDIAEDLDEDDELNEEMDAMDNFLFNKDDSEAEEDNEEELPEDEDIDGEDSDDELAEDEDLDEDEDPESQYKEDIYGRKVDLKTGKIVEEGSTTRALQKLEELDKNDPAIAEQRFKIGKALRGAINRLNERTMVSGIKTVEELFNTSSHNDVKSIFYETFLKATQTVYALPDRLLVEYAMFIALTHVNISPEISSHFVESFTLYLIREMESGKDSDDKALENATALLCHLYNFKVVKAQFVIDLMTKMRNYLREKTVTLMMHSITYSGTNLKKRAGTVFQKFINESQNFFVKLPESEKSPRMKFLIEDLLAVKNGVITSITSKFDESQLDYYGKLFKTLIKGTDHKEDELPFSVDDIIHISDRGRWWVVGSAWKPTEDKVTRKEIVEEKPSKFNSDLLELARKAKMNTETRRSIFCTILGSEDDMEAFEKLLKLSLKGSQEREIIHISVICTMMEANYNQYYAILIERFCHYHKRFIMTTQFALWDRIKELESLKKRQRINLAFLTADLIQMGALALSVLKVVNFGIIDVTTTAFLRRVFYRLFSKSTNSAVTEMFKKLTRSEGSRLLVDGLKLFFEISMKPNSFDEPDAPAVIKKVNLATDILANVE